LKRWAPVTYGRGEEPMKIYFLLMIVSVFVALSYVPIRAEPKQNPTAPPDSVPA
jgi:hypothetical protein